MLNIKVQQLFILFVMPLALFFIYPSSSFAAGGKCHLVNDVLDDCCSAPASLGSTGCITSVTNFVWIGTDTVGECKAYPASCPTDEFSCTTGKCIPAGGGGDPSPSTVDWLRIRRDITTPVSTIYKIWYDAVLGHMVYIPGDAGCADGQVPTWNSAASTWDCAAGGGGLWEEVTGGINYAGGNVGIGTGPPVAALDVKGDTKVKGDFTVYSTITYVKGNNHLASNLTPKCSCDSSIISINCGNSFEVTVDEGSVCYDVTYEALFEYTTTEYIRQSSGAGDFFYVDGDNGKVGIGTATPAKELEVISKGGGGGIQIFGNAYNNNPVSHNSPALTLSGVDTLGIAAGAVFGLSLSDGHFSDNASKGDAVLRASGDDIHFVVEPGLSSSMILKDTGDLALRTENNAYDQSLLFENSDGSYTWRMYRTDAGSNNADLRFASGLSTDFNALTDRVTFKTGGNVGIGTASPDKKLSVIGPVRGAYDAAETEYIEIGHGGSHAYINWAGDGNLDFRYGGSTKATLRQSGGIAVNTGQNDGRNQGLWLWGKSDSNHVIYSAASGTGFSPAGNATVAGYWDSGHRMRFRTYSSGQGFLWENNAETALMDLDADSGSLWIKGDLNVGGQIIGINKHGPYSVSCYDSCDGSNNVRMTAHANSLCFLVMVKIRDTDSTSEHGTCRIAASGIYWYLYAETLAGEDDDADCSARCISW